MDQIKNMPVSLSVAQVGIHIIGRTTLTFLILSVLHYCQPQAEKRVVEAKLEKATSTYAANLKKINEGTVSYLFSSV